jgi:hypothetical protein
MECPATWKVITVGAALTGLGIVGAGAAGASILAAPAALPAGIEAPQFPGVDLGGVTVDLPHVGFVAMDDDWTETYWDDNGNGQRGGDWTETYWDD